MEIISPDSDGNGNSIASSIVFSDSIRTSNIQVYETLNIARNASEFITCLNANDTSKILITFETARGFYVSNKTSTGFTVTNGNQMLPSTTGTVIALRVG
jgi:dipeptidyl aminopeptidase/acylaminoacyl peptidase